VTAWRLSPYGREVQRRFAELSRQGRLRQAYATLGPALAATAASGRAYAAMRWLFGASQRLYRDKGHAGVLTHKPAIREMVAFLRADDQPET
jgi:hypothetical protein